MAAQPTRPRIFPALLDVEPACGAQARCGMYVGQGFQPCVRVMGELRIGTSGWNYPTGKGTWNGLFYPPRKGRGSSVPGFDELSYYAEHFNTVEVNSTSYGTPRAQVSRSWAGSHARRVRVLAQAVSEVHAPWHVQGGTARRPARHAGGARRTRPVNRADIDQFKAGIEPLASTASWARCSRAVSPRAQGHARSRAYLEWLLRRSVSIPYR